MITSKKFAAPTVIIHTPDGIYRMHHSESSLGGELIHIHTYERETGETEEKLKNMETPEDFNPEVKGYHSFTAADARKISESVSTKKQKEQLDKVLKKIYFAAKGTGGCKAISIDFPLNKAVREELENRGFGVVNLGGLAVQKDGVYHNITW